MCVGGGGSRGVDKNIKKIEGGVVSVVERCTPVSMAKSLNQGMIKIYQPLHQVVY